MKINSCQNPVHQPYFHQVRCRGFWVVEIMHASFLCSISYSGAPVRSLKSRLHSLETEIIPKGQLGSRHWLGTRLLKEFFKNIYLYSHIESLSLYADRWLYLCSSTEVGQFHRSSFFHPLKLFWAPELFCAHNLCRYSEWLIPYQNDW